MTLNTEFLLQQALDKKDTVAINQLMATIYPDYNKRQVNVLIAYNEECNIKAIDLINFKVNYPNAKYMALFCFEAEDVKKYCKERDVV